MNRPAIIPIEPCPIALSVSGLKQAIKQYEETFGVTPNLLIVPSTQPAIIPRNMTLRSVAWLPDQAWMVTYGNRGIIYSDGAA